jgi:hypothetical protein
LLLGITPSSRGRSSRLSFTNILLYGDLFGSHESAPSSRYGAIDSDIILTDNDGLLVCHNFGILSLSVRFDLNAAAYVVPYAYRVEKVT